MATIADMIVRLGVDTTKFNKGIQAATKRLDSFGKSATRIGKSMSIAVTAPITATGTAAIYMAANFEQSMNKVSALTQATGADFDALRNQAKALGASTQYSASQAADAMGFLAMAGFDTNQILGAMPSTLQLAAAAQMDLATAADITSNVLTGYQLDVADLARVNDVLVKAFTSSNTDLQQLGEAMKYAGPVASGMGMAFEEAAAAIGMMGNAGIQASMAGTSLRGALTRLANPSSEAINLMAQLGINVFDTSGQMLPFVDVIRQLEQSGIETTEIMEIFGLRAGPAMAALVSQGADALEAFTGKLRDSGGIAQSIADKQMAGFNGAMKRMKSAIEAVAIAVGDSGILDQLTGMVKRIAEVITNVANLNPKLLNMGVVIAGVVATIGPMLVALGLMATTLSALLSPVTLVVAAFAGLVAAGVLVYRNFHRTGKNLANLWQQIKEHILTPVADIAKGLWNWLVVALDKIRVKVWEIIEKIAKPFVWLYNKIVDLFGGDAIDGFIVGATSAITGGLAGSVAAAANVIDILAGQTSGFFSDLGADARDAVTDVQAAFARLRGFLNGTAANIPAAQGLVPVQRAANGMEYLPEIDYDGIDEGITAIDESLARTTESVQGFGNYFQNTFEQMANSYNDLAGAATRWARWTIIQMSAVIAKAIVLQGIMTALGLSEAKGAASLGSTIITGIKGIFGMAEGGIVTQPTLAMIGEGGGPEAVIPLDKLNSIGGRETTINTVVQIDGREVATATGRYLPEVMARRGR